jgi:eukaryotic-like serine/threonine-protein kinase
MIGKTNVLVWVSWCVAAPILGQGAATFRGDLAHTGAYDAPGVPVFHKVKWQFHTGGMVISSPAVVKGVAYFGSTDRNLYAVDVASGALKWKFTGGGENPILAGRRGRSGLFREL